MLSPAAFYKSLPRKRMAAAALLQNERHEILLVKPTYRAGWLLPGGIVEENESPRQACQREVQEEIGISVAIGRLLCLEYAPQEQEKTESLHFIFAGGTLSQQQLEAIHLQEAELSAYRFCSPEDAAQLLISNIARRIAPSLQAQQTGSTIYLEHEAPAG